MANSWDALADQTYSDGHEGEKDVEIEGTEAGFLTFQLDFSNSQKKNIIKKHNSISTYTTTS